LVEPRQAAGQAVATPAAGARPTAPPEFEVFFRTSFPEVVGTAMIAGATRQEAEDAADTALADMFPGWAVTVHENPLAYARQAAVHHFIKAKTRGDPRVIRRLIERGRVPLREGVEDPRLNELEDSEWVASVLSLLPRAQRAVMQCIADGIPRAEIAENLGMSREAVRRNLCDARARLAELLHPDGELKQPPMSSRATREEDR
jgi:DNA-directed RNA polymerase specialized sigma24 family protein